MSDHEYIPKSKAGKWFNDRLPLLTLGAHLTDYPTPKNLNYWWTFGGILTFCLLTQIITGIVLASTNSYLGISIFVGAGPFLILPEIS